MTQKALSQEKQRMEVCERNALEDISNLRAELSREKVKVHSIWWLHCEQQAHWDDEGGDNKDAEMALLRFRIAASGVSM